MQNSFRWSFVVIFLLAGISGFFNSASIISSCILLVTGLFIIPSVFEFLEHRLNFKLSRVAGYVLVIVTVVVALAIEKYESLPKKNAEIYKKNDSPKVLDSLEIKDSQRVHGRSVDFVLVNSIDEFKQRFNSFTKTYSSSLRIENVIIHNGNADDVGKAFEVSFGGQFYLIGGLNKKDESVRSLSTVFEKSNSIDELINYLIAIRAIIYATNPELTLNEINKILEEVGLMNIKNIDRSKVWQGKTERGGVTYNFSILPGQAVLFNAESASN